MALNAAVFWYQMTVTVKTKPQVRIVERDGVRVALISGPE